MKSQRAFIITGSFWELVRFFLLLFIIAALFGAQGGVTGSIIPWLLIAASNALLCPVGWLLLALFPDRYGNLLPLLRLGKVLSVFSVILLLLSGFLSMGVQGLGAAQLISVPIVLFFDLIFLALLISLKSAGGGKSGPAEMEVSSLPEYSETEIKVH
jgi:hypothetical protein